jgi:peptidoglycan/LPS O-acetylase OafA/YrhL
MKAKVPALDAVRFMTAFIVVLYHQCYWRNGSLATPGSPYAAWSFGWIGVEIFFAISGFVIAFSAVNTTAYKFALSRTLRLLPGIWICATLTLAATLWLSNGSQSDIYTRYWHTIFFRVSGNHIDIVYWTLTVEIAFYCVVLALVRLNSFKLLLRTLIAIGLLSSAFNVALLSSQLSPAPHGAFIRAVVGFAQMHSSRLLLLRHGCFFTFGALIWSRLTIHRPRFLPLLFLILLIGTTAEVFYDANDRVLSYPMQHLSAFTPPSIWLVGLSLIFISSLPTITRWLGAPQTVRALRNVGLLTFPLYLVHNNLGLLVQERLTGLTQSRAIGTSLAIFFCVALAYVISTYIEPLLTKALRFGLLRLSEFLKAGRLTSRVWLAAFPEETARGAGAQH